jgi:hypothetical protein
MYLPSSILGMPLKKVVCDCSSLPPLAATENCHHLRDLIDPLMLLHFVHIGQNLRSCSQSLNRRCFNVSD